MNALLRDLHYAARLLAKSPTFTSAVVLSLAIGIGANAAIFSIINGILLKPLPFKNSERLVTLWEQPFKNRVAFASLSGPNYKDCKEQSRLLEGLSGFTRRKEVTLIGPEGAERIGTRRVTGDFFATLQVKPVVGRWFLDQEAEAAEPRVAVITEALWKRRFGARPDVIGGEITLDREVYNIVGVSPSVFESLSSQPVDVILPLPMKSAEMMARDVYLLDVIGTLKPGVALPQIQAEMDVIAAQIAGSFPSGREPPAIKVFRPGGLTIMWYRGLLITLQAAVLFVLLIACTNVASLLLARWTGRQQELAIRAALGATGASMLRLALCESILLVLSGTLLGVWLADVFRRAILAVAPAHIPRLAEVQLDTNVIVGIIALSASMALFFGLVPLMFSRRIVINDWLRQGGRAATPSRARNRLRNVLVASQVTLTVVLLAGAGLFIRSLWRLQGTELGFNQENLLTFHLFVDSVRYRTPDEVARFYALSLERITSIPGIGETSLVSHPPFSGGAMGNRVAPSGRMQTPGGALQAQTVIVTPNYFPTLEIKLIRGRLFAEADSQGAPPVVLVNENLARQLASSGDPVGMQLEIEAARFPDPDNVQPRTAHIVGVVANTKQFVLTMPPQNIVYVPFAQNPAPSMFVVAKTRIHPAAVIESVRRAILELDRDQPVFDVKMMAERIRASESERRFNATLLVLFAGLALVATAIGIYGTLSYWVSQRRHEFGVRMALGAGRHEVLSLVLRKIAWLLLVGVLLGLPASMIAIRLIRAFVYQGQAGADLFYGVSSLDPIATAVTLFVLIVSSAFATVIPALRATKVNPVEVLQAQ